MTVHDDSRGFARATNARRQRSAAQVSSVNLEEIVAAALNGKLDSLPVEWVEQRLQPDQEGRDSSKSDTNQLIRVRRAEPIAPISQGVHPGWYRLSRGTPVWAIKQIVSFALPSLIADLRSLQHIGKLSPEFGPIAAFADSLSVKPNIKLTESSAQVFAGFAEFGKAISIWCKNLQTVARQELGREENAAREARRQIAQNLRLVQGAIAAELDWSVVEPYLKAAERLVASSERNLPSFWRSFHRLKVRVDYAFAEAEYQANPDGTLDLASPPKPLSFNEMGDIVKTALHSGNMLSHWEVDADIRNFRATVVIDRVEYILHIFCWPITGTSRGRPYEKRIQISRSYESHEREFTLDSSGNERCLLLGVYQRRGSSVVAAWNPAKYRNHATPTSCYNDVRSIAIAMSKGYAIWQDSDGDEVFNMKAEYLPRYVNDLRAAHTFRGA